MAKELRVGVSGFNFKKTDAPTINVAETVFVTVSGVHAVHASQNIGTGDETLDIAAVGTIGFVYFKNLDDTNFILIGEDGSSYPIKLMPGEIAVMRWSAAAIHAKSDTAACDLEYAVIED